jgi:dGTPase
MLKELFHAYMEDIRLLPPEHQMYARQYETDGGTVGRARAVADYIAGMTDRFAIAEYRRVFDPRELT